jgi:hypothetical protein
MMLKLTYFSMSKLIAHYFQPFWAPLLNIGYEKHPCEYVMNFENLWTFIGKNKKL